MMCTITFEKTALLFFQSSIKVYRNLVKFQLLEIYRNAYFLAISSISLKTGAAFILLHCSRKVQSVQ